MHGVGRLIARIMGERGKIMDFLLLFDELCDEAEATGREMSRYECFLRGALMMATDPERRSELKSELERAIEPMF